MKKKIALITGASGGIGGACAETLARAGYTVLLHGCHGLEHAKALADRLCAEGCDAHAVCCDLADSESAQAMCRDILALYHRVDALVLCAGVSHTGLFCDMTDEQWRTVMDVNVSGMFYLIRALAPGMVSRNEGAIVTVSSMWGRVGASCEVAYSASKAAVIGLTRALAKELCPEGTVFFPGWLEDVNSFYQALDVNVLTSLSETFPYALTEGARMHCATIASNVGGVPYLIDDGENGLLFEPQDVSALTAHMLTLATDAAKRRGMGEALYEKTKRDFSVQAMVEKQKHYYEIIIRRFRRPKLERDGVVICGAYGKGNGGDNAILDAIVAQLRHIDPDLPICALSRTPKETRAAACVDSLYTFRLLAIRRRMRHAKLYLSGGGTLIQDTTSTRSLLYYLSSIRMAARAGCRVMLYGCGVGPVSRPRNCERTAKTLNRYAEIISLRDRYSEETLRALGVTTPEIHLTADPALLIDPGDTPAIRSFLHHSGLADGTRYALFALRPWKDFDRHIAAFANAAEYAHREYSLTPVLYAMEPCRDRAALNAVAAQLRCPYLLLEAGSNGTEIVALIRRMSLVIAMRLHTLIFAAGQGVPIVGVVYDPKVSGFLDYLGQDLYLPLEEASAASLCDLIDTAMAEQMFEAENIRSLRELAAENEELARHLLTEE